MKRVLVIAYYFPPMGFSGIQRTLKFVKYLPEFGWNPTVLTVTPHAYFAFDDTFLDELAGKPVEIWRTEPGGIFSAMKKRRTVSLSNERLRKILNRISQFFFIPDNKVGWRRQVRKFLAGKDLSHYDIIFATAPPFTDHLIGAELKERHGIPLVLDFRDAWVEYPYHKYWTSWHRRRHVELERGVVRAADAVITTNRYVRDLLIARQESPDAASRIHVITQGFDPADFRTPTVANVPELDHATINFVYTGIFYEDRDPLVLYRALAAIRTRRPEIYRRMKFYMVGYMQEEYQEMARTMGVDDRIVYCGYVEHHIAVEWVRRADVLWFNIGAQHKGYETVSPGKAFEYLGSRKPIVAILPENQIREILSGFSHTFIVDPDDHEHLAEVLIDLTERHERGTLPEGDPEAIALYDRKRLTGELARIFEEILTTKGTREQ
jgi:glycosyltransferase involved in cell wall biosynthesis